MVSRMQISKESNLVFLLLLFLFQISYGQGEPIKFIELDVARSIHGSGDLRGINFSSNYVFQKNRFSQLVFIKGTIHDGEDTQIFELPGGRINDGSIRYTTAGVQVGYGIRYGFIKLKKHDTEIGVNGFGRYQSSSLYDVLTTYFAPLSDLPFPVAVFEHFESARTYAVGLNLILSHRFQITETVGIKAFGDFQYDTNGDTIRGYGLGISKVW